MKYHTKANERSVYTKRQRQRCDDPSYAASLFWSHSIVTVRNSSCGKVMFSQAYVGKFCPQGGVHPSGQTPTGRHPPDDHCSGRYVSCWNAFLFSIRVVVLASPQSCRSIDWISV